MVFFYVLITLVYALPVFIYFLYGAKNNFSSSDHYTHQLFIDLIRQNKGRFIKVRGNILNESEMAYPQLLHWFIAILPERWGNFIVRYMQLFVAALMSGAHFLFVWYAFPHFSKEDLGFFGELQFGGQTEPELFMLISALIFVLTPYTFNFNNAKNRGLSSRGLGVMLGQLFLYTIFLWEMEHHYAWLIAGSAIVLLILLINRFAFQFVLFGTPFLMIFCFSWWVGIPLLGGSLLFFMLFPRIATRYFKGQWNHKKVYSKYLAERYILRHRKSIWGDFIFEFPVRIYRWVRHKPFSNFHQWPYILSNPVILIALQIPFLVLVLIFGSFHICNEHMLFWQDANVPFIGNHGSFYVLFYMILTTVGIFILTSFRKTRFLGEPERYIEFAIAPISLIIPMVVHNKWIIFGVLVFCAVRIIMMSHTYLTKVVTTKDMSEILAIRDFLLERAKDHEVRILATHTQDKKALRVVGLKLFDFVLNREESSGFHVNEVFPEDYDLVNLEILGRLTEKLDLNYLVTHEAIEEEVKNKLQASNYTLTFVQQSADIKVFSIQKTA